MFNSFLNSLYLRLWAGTKKVGPRRRVLLSKSYETYGDMVYDLTWKVRYIHSKNLASHAVYITERASKWNLRRTIRRVEKHKLPKVIEELVSKHTHTDKKVSKH